MTDNFNIKAFFKNQYLKEATLGNSKAQLLADEFNDKFNVNVSPMMLGDGGKIEILVRSNIPSGEFEEMIQWIEGKGYKVDRDQSENQFDYDDDRYYYPRIQFSK
jgi:hypothetical protein